MFAGEGDRAVEESGNAFTYTYAANSLNLIGTITGPVGILITHTWEHERDLFSVKKNEVDPAMISQFPYVVNDLSQREEVTTTGTASANANHGWAWGDDALGQVTEAENAANTDFNRAYAFGVIGNRTCATDGFDLGATVVGYTPNALNDYASINPGAEVNPAYDDDGNLVDDADINAMAYGLKFEWDAENRVAAVTDAGNELLATYAFDHLGRRIRKTTTAAAAQTASDTAYVYDGWNLYRATPLPPSANWPEGDSDGDKDYDKPATGPTNGAPLRAHHYHH